MSKEVIEIWSPKYSTNSVLIATYKVTDGTNLIKFTKAKHLDGLYKVEGDVIRNCPTISNGKITCFDVPMEYLKKAN